MLVATTTPRVDLGSSPRVGLVIGDAPDPGKVWLDYNMMGTHIPQMYNLDEIEQVSEQICIDNDLCVSCLGYGRVARSERTLLAAVHEIEANGTIEKDVMCPACKGSGTPAFHVETWTEGNSTYGKIIPRDA